MKIRMKSVTGFATAAPTANPLGGAAAVSAAAGPVDWSRRATAANDQGIASAPSVPPPEPDCSQPDRRAATDFAAPGEDATTAAAARGEASEALAAARGALTPGRSAPETRRRASAPRASPPLVSGRAAEPDDASADWLPRTEAEEPSEPDESAIATGIATTAEPTPSAAANSPTRPIQQANDSRGERLIPGSPNTETAEDT